MFTNPLGRRARRRHRIEAIDHIAHDTSDTLCARIVIETDPEVLAMITAALAERRSIFLALAHIEGGHMEGCHHEHTSGPATAPFNPWGDCGGEG